VIAYISQTFPTFGQLPSNGLIRRTYAESLLHPASNEIASVLSLLALSLSTGSRLTTGLQAPATRFQQRVLSRGVDELGVNAIDDPNVDAFLVIETAGAQLERSLETMVNTVRELVGTLDFGVEYRATAEV
jgi:hypothetical protein